MYEEERRKLAVLSLEEFDRTAWHALALSGDVPITVYHARFIFQEGNRAPVCLVHQETGRSRLRNTQ